MGLSCGVICVILRWAVLIQYRSVTDTHTHTHRHTTMAYIALSIASRGKNRQLSSDIVEDKEYMQCTVSYPSNASHMHMRTQKGLKQLNNPKGHSRASEMVQSDSQMTFLSVVYSNNIVINGVQQFANMLHHIRDHSLLTTTQQRWHSLFY